MAKKFLIECPNCRRVNEASMSFFSKRIIECQCGNLIDVKTERMRTKECPKCGNLIVYDKSKTNDPICPVCKEHLINSKEDYKFVEIVCPNCSCHITGKKDDKVVECPLCGTNIDVQKRLKEQEYLEKEQPTLLKSETSSDVCVCKHHLEDFKYGSQIVVNESQVALFIKDGKLAGKFEAGRHLIDTNNLLLGKDNYNEKNVSFHSQLFFITKTFQINQKWGTDSKVRMFDPLSGLHVELGAYGTYNFQITDYEKFLFYVIGLGEDLEKGIKAEEVSLKFRPNVISAVKNFLGKIIKENDVNILEVDLHLQEISEGLLKEVNKQIEKFGIQLTDFIISNVMTPDDDPNFKRMKEQYAERYLRVQEERIKQAEAMAARDRIMTEVGTETEVELARAKSAAEAYKMKAEAEAMEMKMKGYTYQDETKRMVSTTAAAGMAASAVAGHSGNDGISGLAEEAVKAGMIKQMGKNITNDLIDAMNPRETFRTPAKQNNTEFVEVNNDAGWNCPNCGNTGITSKFCPECGTRKPESETWDCPNCGTKGIKTKFCPECGTKRD